MRLEDKVAIVTGASNGIGHATAELFAEEGATVYGGDLAVPDGGERKTVRDRTLDVGDLDSWAALVNEIVDQHDRIDIVVNNAGIVHTYDTITEVSLEDWDTVLRVNLSGVFFGMRTVIPVMQRGGGGSIVNFSSIWGIAGAPGVAPYQASKGAVRTLTKNAAMTYVGDGIRANSVHPGLVYTPLIAAQDAGLTQGVLDATPMKRGADPREIAYGVLYLASDESRFVTGTEFVIDGGYLLP